MNSQQKNVCACGSCRSDWGEVCLTNAPQVSLSDGRVATPQQFFRYHRTLANIEAVLSDIESLDDYPLFAGQMGEVFYIQVGVIGVENYGARSANKPHKIVYGRRWHIEPWAPTSEVVQTALLATQKAREHELREYITYTHEGRLTTPFNTHQDLPLMACHSHNLMEVKSDRKAGRGCPDKRLARIRLDGMRFNVLAWEQRNSDQAIVDIGLEGRSVTGLFKDMEGREFTLIVNPSDADNLVYALVEHLVKLSNDFVCEHFRFKRFARFSQQLSTQKLAQFSYESRRVAHADKAFLSEFKEMSCEVDSSRAPALNAGRLGDKQRELLSAYADLQGYLPKGV